MYRLAPPMAHGAGIVGTPRRRPFRADRRQPSIQTFCGPAVPRTVVRDAAGMVRRSTLVSDLRRRVATARNGRSHHPSYPTGDGSSRHCSKEPTFVWQNDEGCHGISHDHHAPEFRILAIGLTDLDSSRWSGLMACANHNPHPEEADTRRGDRHDRLCCSCGYAFTISELAVAVGLLRTIILQCRNSMSRVHLTNNAQSQIVPKGSSHKRSVRFFTK